MTGPESVCEFLFLERFLKIHVSQPWPCLTTMTYKYDSNYNSPNASKEKIRCDVASKLKEPWA